MSFSPTARRLGLGSALLALACLAAGVPPASAKGPDGFTPTDAEASATAKVQAFLADHPRPEPPAPDATADTHAEYTAAISAFIRDFPFDAGFAQWGCTSRQAGTVEIEGGLAVSRVLRCEQGDPPSIAQITAPRTTAEAGGRSPVCETVRGGHHCLELRSSFPGYIDGWYRWLGLGTIYGTLAFGRSSLPAPGCDVGENLINHRGGALESGEIQYLSAYLATPSNFSSVFYHEDEQGNRGGIRSLMCAFFPSAQGGSER